MKRAVNETAIPAEQEGLAHRPLGPAPEQGGGMAADVRATRTQQVQARQRAQAALGKGDWQYAERLYRALLSVDQQDQYALKGMVAICLSTRRHNEAFVFATRLRELADDDAESFNLLGAALHALGRPDAAAAALREALRLDPACDAALDNYALILRSQGQLETAAGMFEALLARHPHSARLWQRYAGSRAFAVGAPEAVLLDELLASNAEAAVDGGRGAGDRALLLWSRAKLYLDAGDADAAFAMFSQANTLRCQRHADAFEPFRRGELLDQAERLIQGVTADVCEHWRGRVRSRRGITLLLGPPRSGKSLLESALAEHAAIGTYGELDTLDLALAQLGSAFSGLDPAGLIRIGKAEARRAAAVVDAGLVDAGPGDSLQEDVCTRLLTTPGLNQHAGVLMLLNPAMRLVICERDPVANAMAIHTRHFDRPQPYAWQVDTAAEYVAVYRRLTRHWAELFPGRVAYVKYEDLVASPDETVERVLAFHGLSWQPACANQHGFELSPVTVGYSGSVDGRARISPAFNGITVVFGNQVPLFRDALERAFDRVKKRLG